MKKNQMTNISGRQEVWLKRLCLLIPLMILMTERSEAQNFDQSSQTLTINRDEDRTGTNEIRFKNFLDGSNKSEWRLRTKIGEGIRFRYRPAHSGSNWTEVMYWGEDGNVGIGKLNPTEALDINGNVKANNFFGDGSQLTGIDASQIANLPTGGGSSLWSENGSKIFYNQGFVGIGLDNPASKLEVMGDISLGRAYKIKFLSVPGGDDRAYIRASNSTATNNYNSLIFAVGNGEESMFIQGTGTGLVGNVGIGTQDPTEKLEVAGTAKASALHLHDVGLARMKFTSSTTGETANDGFHIGTSGTVDAIINNKEAGDLNIATNNLTRITVKSDGRIGIGTTSPDEALEVDGTVKATAFVGDGSQLMSLNAANLTGVLPELDASNLLNINASQIENLALDLQLDGTVLSLGGEGSVDLANTGFIGSDGSLPIRVINDKIGIGTLNPERTFHFTRVGQDDGWDGGMRIDRSFSGPIIVMAKYPASSPSTYLDDPTIVPQSSFAMRVQQEYFGFWNLQSEVGINEEIGDLGPELVIHTNGNVGIGNDQPSEKLDVDGTVKAAGFSGDGAAITNINPDNITGLDSMISATSGFEGGLVNNNITIASDQGLTIKNSEVGNLPNPNVDGTVIYDMNFHNNSETGGNYFDGDGGGLAVYNAQDGWSAIIDTKNMKHLDAEFNSVVSNTMVATRFAVSANSSFDNWPDYVFDAEYELTPLEEVEAYISKNKHLPQVPSAADVAEEGIDLGNMDKTLLKKIEELTLYIIEQNKRIEQLEAKLADQ